MISYAQNGEDVVLERAFREKALGFYIDVRAGDPTDAAAAILERVRALLGRPEGARASNGK